MWVRTALALAADLLPSPSQASFLMNSEWHRPLSSVSEAGPLSHGSGRVVRASLVHSAVNTAHLADSLARGAQSCSPTWTTTSPFSSPGSARPPSPSTSSDPRGSTGEHGSFLTGTRHSPSLHLPSLARRRRTASTVSFDLPCPDEGIQTDHSPDLVPLETTWDATSPPSPSTLLSRLRKQRSSPSCSAGSGSAQIGR